MHRLPNQQAIPVNRYGGWPLTVTTARSGRSDHHVMNRKARTTTTSRRWAGMILLLLLLPLTVMGCAARSFPDTPIRVLPQGGVNTAIGQMHLDDIWVQGPNGVAAGGSAPLHLAMTNDSTRDDTLVRVSTPVAHQVTVRPGGIAVPASGQVNLEDHTDLVLHDVQAELRNGEWFPVTFEFAQAGTVTVDVTVGPLGQ
jgi:copper(I)-binding protein